MGKFSKTRRDSLRPAAYEAAIPPSDGATLPIWTRWCEHRDEADFHRLVLHYLPFVRIEAYKLKRRNPAFYVDDVDEMISDGSLGLIEFISKVNRPNVHIRFLCGRVRRAMRLAISRRLPRRGTRKEDVLRDIRQKLILDLGRAPATGEMLQAMRGVLSNPAFDVVPQTEFSQFEDPNERRAALAMADDSIAAPAARLTEHEAVQLALKGLHGDDRKMFRAFLAGKSSKEIASSFGLLPITISRRCDAMLWNARKRSDLVQYFGAEAVESASRPQKKVIKFKPDRGSIPAHLVAMKIGVRPNVPALVHEERSDDQLLELLRGGYSPRYLYKASRGPMLRQRLQQLQKQIIAECANVAPLPTLDMSDRTDDQIYDLLKQGYSRQDIASTTSGGQAAHRVREIASILVAEMDAPIQKIA